MSKAKPIFVITLPSILDEQIDELKITGIKDDYYIILVCNPEITEAKFQLFNSEELEPSALDEIKYYLNKELVRD